MKLRSLALLVAALLLPSLVLAAPASTPPPAPGDLVAALALDAPSCAGAASLSLTPQPLFRADLVVCGSVCSAALCSGRPVGEACGTSTATHCQIIPSCVAGQVSCACR